MRILVLGAGFGGLELTSRLSDEFGDAAEITLIDKSDSFVFGFSKLDVMFGRSTVEHVRHAYADIMRPAVHFVQTAISAIDPSTRTVSTGSGEYSGDVVVVALGADLHPELTPGLVEAGQEFYTVEGAIAAREAIDGFPGGRVVIGLAGTPFKCPPAPSETALLMHDFLTSRGVRESSAITLVMPFSAPIPPSPAASSALVAAFAERDIEWVPDQVVRSLDPDRRVAVLGDGRELDFDLYLGVPIHRAPAVVRNSPMA